MCSYSALVVQYTKSKRYSTDFQTCKNVFKQTTYQYPNNHPTVGTAAAYRSGFHACPLAVCYVYDELEEAKSFIYSIAITAASGLAITLFVRTQNNDMGKREGFLITSLTWVVFSLFGMLPFVFGNTHMSVSDAFLKRCQDLPPQEFRPSHPLRMPPTAY